MSGGDEAWIVWNGELRENGAIPVDPLSDGWLYGYNCFETMAWTGGKLRFFEDHWDRLARTATAMGLGPVPEPEVLRGAADQLAERNRLPAGAARVSLHRGRGRTDWLFRLRPEPRVDAVPASLRTCFPSMPHPGFSPMSAWKDGNYVAHLLAHREARSRAYDEALLARSGEIVEGALSNFFVWRDGQLQTPPLSSGALPGVVRERLLRIGAEGRGGGQRVREGRVRVADLREAEAVYLSNALLPLVPVREIEGHHWEARHDPAAPLREALLAEA